jgi:hypothetical protein
MRNLGLLCSFSVLALAAAITLACGTSPKVNPPGCNPYVTGSNTTGTLQSITVCPAVADAEDYDGQVQFFATGFYNTPPTMVTPLPAFWGACYQKAPTDAVVVSSNGLAQCTAGASGTFSVFASKPTTCTAIAVCGSGWQISGYSQLTCP